MYSFDLPFLYAMLAGAVLAVAAHPLVNGIFRWIIHSVAERSLKAPGQQGRGTVEDRVKQILTAFDLHLAGTIGCIERAIYVFAVIAPAYDLVIAWLIMKAFHDWQSEHERSDLPVPHVTVYHLYVVGNAVSLVVGLFIGVVVAAWMVHLRSLR